MSVCIVCKANVTGHQHALECDACGLWCQGRSQGNEFSELDSVSGTNGPGTNDSSRERKVQGANVPGNERS